MMRQNSGIIQDLPAFPEQLERKFVLLALGLVERGISPRMSHSSRPKQDSRTNKGTDTPRFGSRPRQEFRQVRAIKQVEDHSPRPGALNQKLHRVFQIFRLREAAIVIQLQNKLSIGKRETLIAPSALALALLMSANYGLRPKPTHD
jgi:hypothetical protein